MIHGTSGNKQMADQNEMFSSLVYICLQEKKQTNKQTNKSNKNKQTNIAESSSAVNDGVNRQRHNIRGG